MKPHSRIKKRMFEQLKKYIKSLLKEYNSVSSKEMILMIRQQAFGAIRFLIWFYESNDLEDMAEEVIDWWHNEIREEFMK